LLLRPHHFIFNRRWYEEFGGRDGFDEYCSEFRALSESDRVDLVSTLSTFENRRFQSIKRGISNAKVAKLIRFYKPISDSEESEIWKMQRDWIRQPCVVPDDERVEDAGLELELFST